jgi:hypothetical protein
MPSLEILLEKTKEPLALDDPSWAFAVRVSRPPVSDREPSLWQQQFAQLGGSLVHVGDPDCRTTQSWYSAYSLLDDEKCKTFRFKTEYWDSMVSLLKLLANQSLSGCLHFTTDWQFGPKAKRYVRSYTLSQFIALHDRKGIRFNSWSTIVPEKNKRTGKGSP